jgi:hypothetical protein
MHTAITIFMLFTMLGSLAVTIWASRRCAVFYILVPANLVGIGLWVRALMEIIQP